MILGRTTMLKIYASIVDCVYCNHISGKQETPDHYSCKLIKENRLQRRYDYSILSKCMEKGAPGQVLKLLLACRIP